MQERQTDAEDALARRFREYAELGARSIDPMVVTRDAIAGRPGTTRSRGSSWRLAAGALAFALVVAVTGASVAAIGFIRSNGGSSPGAFGGADAAPMKLLAHQGIQLDCVNVPEPDCTEAAAAARSEFDEHYDDGRQIERVEVLGPAIQVLPPAEFDTHGEPWPPRPDVTYWCDVDPGYSPVPGEDDPAVLRWLSDGSPADASLPCALSVNVVFWMEYRVSNPSHTWQDHRVMRVWRWAEAEPLWTESLEDPSTYH